MPANLSILLSGNHYKPKMMKHTIILTTVIIFIAGCSKQTGSQNDLQAQIDSLRVELENTYKPGFGEFMSSVQVHHAKLWFAGKNENWDLAGFEIDEMKEAIESIKKYETDQQETMLIGMIEPVLDSVTLAVEQQDTQSFEDNFMQLTNTCNKCHAATNHGFNKIIIPTSPPVSNQSFGSVGNN